MNLTITGHHLDVTPAIRGYVQDKMDRATRHFDQIIDVTIILSVEKLEHKAEANVHVPGRDIYVESIDADMYAALDSLADKLDRQILKHKEKSGNVHRESGGVKGQSVAAEAE